jgi:hypothetical protein
MHFYMRILIINCFVIALFSAQGMTDTSPMNHSMIQMHRVISEQTPCTASVTMSMQITGTIQSYAVEEKLAKNLIPKNMNEAGQWDSTHNAIKWGPFQDQIVRTFSYDISGYLVGEHTFSGIISFDGTIQSIQGDTSIQMDCIQETVATPTILLSDTTIVPVQISITCETPDAEIFYTTDGQIPDKSSLLYTSPITFDSPVTIQAIAFYDDMRQSDIATMSYTLPLPYSQINRTVTPNNDCSAQINLQISPATSVYLYAVEERISQNLSPTNISDNGVWDQVHQRIKWGPFEDNQTRVLNYELFGLPGEYNINGIASFDGHSTPIDGVGHLSFTCELEYVENPIIRPADGTAVPVTITIASNTSGAIIYYTIDGSIPDNQSIIYQSPIILNKQAHIKAIAYKKGMIESAIVEADYPDPVDPPVPFFVDLNRRIENTQTKCSSMINIHILPADHIQSYAIEEWLPSEIIPKKISHNGLWDQENQRLKWGPFEDINSKDLTYTVRAINGEYEIKGIASFDGKSASIPGNNQINIACNPGFGDINGDGVLSLKDVICILKMMTKGSTDDFIYNMADVNDDLKIGIDEVLYLMTNLSE